MSRGKPVAVNVRPYREADENQVIQLWKTCELVVPWNDPAKDIARKLKVDRDLLLVGEIDGRIIATVMAGYEGHRGWVNYLAVAPHLQGHGLGRQLMDEVERRLRQRGCPKINLQVRATNRKVIAFYESIGYKVDDCVSLGKRLEPDSPHSAQDRPT